MLSRFKGRFGLLASPLLLWLCGCGDSTADVSGKVTFQNKTVKGGNITFVHQGGKPSVSTSINEDGTYKAMKVPSGEVKICVETETLNPAKRSKTPKYAPPPGQSAPEGMFNSDNDAMGKRFVKIPESYSKPETTDLKLTVGSGVVEHNIELR